MKTVSERYTNVADRFTARVQEVPASAWANEAPCEGWVARDVVRHLVDWVPGFFQNLAGLDLGVAGAPSVDDDPLGAWNALDASLRGALADPSVASRTFEMQGTTRTIEEAIGMFVLSDVVVHTWDLARATGLDETLDPEEVHGMLEGMLPMDEVLRQSGHYGPKVSVPDDADEQTRLIAFTGRRP
jgi:uncharacterized protein (TIGR03086 family)